MDSATVARHRGLGESPTRAIRRGCDNSGCLSMSRNSTLGRLAAPEKKRSCTSGVIGEYNTAGPPYSIFIFGDAVKARRGGSLARRRTYDRRHTVSSQLNFESGGTVGTVLCDEFQKRPFLGLPLTFLVHPLLCPLWQVSKLDSTIKVYYLKDGTSFGTLPPCLLATPASPLTTKPLICKRMRSKRWGAPGFSLTPSVAVLQSA
jgi:hypothetical protein